MLNCNEDVGKENNAVRQHLSHLEYFQIPFNTYGVEGYLTVVLIHFSQPACETGHGLLLLFDISGTKSELRFELDSRSNRFLKIF